MLKQQVRSNMCLILNGDHHLHSKLLCQLCGQAGGIRNRQRWCHGVRGKHFHFDHDLLTGLVRGLCDSLGCQHKKWDRERFVEKRVGENVRMFTTHAFCEWLPLICSEKWLYKNMDFRKCQMQQTSTNHPLLNTFGQSNNL